MKRKIFWGTALATVGVLFVNGKLKLGFGKVFDNASKKVVDTIQNAADYVAKKFEKTEENITDSNETVSESAS